MPRHPAASAHRRDVALLMVSLGIDNLGSGMFLPLTLVYATNVVGVPLGLAGSLVSGGAAVGLLVPLLAGGLVDRLGPRTIVISAQLLQLVGMVVYLLAHGPATLFAAALLVSCGSQLFYSALFTYIGVVAPQGPKDHFFARIDMVRSGCFGLGALVAGIVLTIGTSALTAAVVTDAASFVLAAMLGLVVSAGGRLSATQPSRRSADGAAGPAGSISVWRNRPFLMLVVATALITFSSDFFLVGFPVYALDRLHTPGWVPGVCVTILTLAISTLTAWMVRCTGARSRTSVIATGAAVLIVWAVLVAVAALLPSAALPAWLIATTVVLAAGSLTVGTRPNALAESLAPAGAKGRHLSVFQFGFAIASAAAPLLSAGFAVGEVFPWAIVAALALAGGALMLVLGRRRASHGR